MGPVGATSPFRVGDALAIAVGGELRLVEVVTIVEGRLVCADATDQRRRVLHVSVVDAERRAEKARLS